MIVFGGRNVSGTALGDVWSLSLDDPPTWTQIIPTGTPPSPRFGHSAVYESEPLPPGRMLVYGGNSDRQLWALSLGMGTEAWSALSGNGLPPDVYSGHTAVQLDDGSSPGLALVMLVLGGLSASVWELNDPRVDAVGSPVAAALTLEGAFPNPEVGALSVAFVLPDGRPARLEVFDLAGRKIAARDVGALGAGRHVVRLTEEGTLAPGLYLVKLTRGAESRTSKVAVLR
jgi:hypothetical protein